MGIDLGYPPVKPGFHRISKKSSISGVRSATGVRNPRIVSHKFESTSQQETVNLRSIMAKDTLKAPRLWLYNLYTRVAIPAFALMSSNLSGEYAMLPGSDCHMTVERSAIGQIKEHVLPDQPHDHTDTEAIPISESDTDDCSKADSKSDTPDSSQTQTSPNVAHRLEIVEQGLKRLKLQLAPGMYSIDQRLEIAECSLKYIEFKIQSVEKFLDELVPWIVNVHNATADILSRQDDRCHGIGGGLLPGTYPDTIFEEEGEEDSVGLGAGL